MTLPLLRLAAGAVDDEDFYRRLIEARDTEAEECGCRACDPGWWADEEQYERQQDR